VFSIDINESTTGAHDTSILGANMYQNCRIDVYSFRFNVCVPRHFHGNMEQ
jgi:hypothetical protein